MKNQNTLSRKINRLIGSLILVAVVGLVGAFAYTDYQADRTTGIEHVQYQSQSEMFGTLLVAAIAIPAIHSMRVSNSVLGFQKARVFVPELNYYVSHAGLALWNFLSKSDEVSGDTVDQLRKGNLKIVSFNASLKFIITSMSGNQEIFTSATQWRQGRIPEIFNNAQLPDGTNLAVSHIGLAYATDATATVPEGDVDYTRVPTAWPAAMANGELVIHQNGIKERIEAKFAGSQANGTQASVEADGYEFEAPFILQEKKQIKLEFRFAAGQAISGTNNHFLDICMIGAQIKKKN